MSTHDTEAERSKVVIDDYGGILPYFEAFYLESIIYAAGRAIDAFQRFDNACAHKKDDASIVAAVHEALTHTAAVSRFFWPSRDGIATARSNSLRVAFGLTDASALHDRELRNALEHYDERLDVFLLQDMAGHLFPGAMVASATLADNKLGKIFRLVDPTTEIFVLFGRKHKFGPMRTAIETVLAQANKMSTEGGRLRTDP